MKHLERDLRILEHIVTQQCQTPPNANGFYCCVYQLCP